MIDKKYGQDHLKDLPMEYDFTELLLTKPDSIIKQIDTALQLLASSNGKTVQNRQAICQADELFERTQPWLLYGQHYSSQWLQQAAG